MAIGQNMMLVHSAFRNAKSFTLIPVSLDSPYTEALYDPSSGILAVVSKVMKQSYHMVPRLDDNGDPMRLQDKVDIETFIQMFAVNAESFDYQQYFVDVKETKTSPIILPGQ